jgi:hypothetical protein
MRLKLEAAPSDMPAMMRSPALFSRWGRRSTLGAPSSLQLHASPPSLRHVPASAWGRLMFWLLAPAPQDASPPLNRLPGVRRAFLDVLKDVDSEDATRLRWQLENAQSLRELWHLRAETYRVISLALSQSAAEARVGSLSCHFPARAPRSQFAPAP